jgi:hypothetical protein
MATHAFTSNSILTQEMRGFSPNDMVHHALSHYYSKAIYDTQSKELLD